MIINKKVFNGEIVQVITYEEALAECLKENYEKIFTATLVIGKNTLYFSDAIYKEKFKNEGKIALTIEFFNEEDMLNIFNTLENEGIVLNEIKETNWGSLYGSIRDKFGLIWNFNCEMTII